MGRLNDIHDLLSSIKNQIEENYELVFVTERDRNLKRIVAKEAKNLGLLANVVHNEGSPGLAEARNLGASAATGEILGFVDDDVVLDQGWSKAVEEAFRRYPRVAGVTGPAYPLWVGQPAQCFPKEFDWLIGCTRWFCSDRMVEVRNCWGMNMAFRSHQFEKAGGFSVETGYHRGKMAEDVDLSLRLRARTGGLLVYVPQILVWNKVYAYRLSNKFIIERSRWIGHSRNHIRKSVAQINSKMASFEDKLLLGVLKSFVYPKDGCDLSYTVLKKRYKTLLIATSFLLIGYLAGPLE